MFGICLSAPLGELLSARGLNSADSTSATHAEVEWNLPGVLPFRIVLSM